MKHKLRIGVLFGGRSAEHEVSLVSAASVIRALDKEKYEIIPIGITPQGKWLSFLGVLDLMKSGSGTNRLPEKLLLPDPQYKGLVEIGRDSSSSLRLDVIFPLLHGTYGEDGTVQGLFELSNIPYVGAGVLGSAAGMDKVVAKQLFRQSGIPVVPDVWFLAADFKRKRKQILQEIERKLRSPYFVKPANLGSSVGISKAHTRKELEDAIVLASKYDRKILVEQSIEHAREIEVSVLGNDEPAASLPGEIIPSNEFYDYDAKYIDGKSTAIIPAKLSRRVIKRIQSYAELAFLAIDCAGMARVDFLVQKETDKIFLSEINTIPGFTSISMYPKLWEASSIPYPKLLDRLIGFAIERHREKSKLRTTFKSKKNWYRS